MQLNIPEKVESIIKELENAGFEAYAVGGCVRDCLLQRKPNDWDITTSARPEEVKMLFRRTIDTGLQHGTVTVMIEKEGFEVTTYRVDGEYEDGRHPKEVTFTASLEEDLKRRDFTINAMAYNPSTGIVDLFGGMDDIKNKMIRCVGNPIERFTEDALRIMRAVRFSAQLGFEIDEKTLNALSLIAPNLKKVSAERIQTELVKLLESPNPDYLKIAYLSDITKEFLPEFDVCMKTAQNNIHHCYSVGEHILHSLKYVRNNKALRITMLLHDIGKPVVKTTDEKNVDHFKTHSEIGQKMACDILRRLKFDNETIKTVTTLIKWHDERIKPDAREIRYAINAIGEDYFPLLLEVQYADTMAQSNYKREEKLGRIEAVKEVFFEILEKKQCTSLKSLAVTGKDLINMGMKPGKEVGEALAVLLNYVLDNPDKNEKDELLSYLQEHRVYPE